VCNALALLQCVASHTETRSAFLLAHIPLYLYPFLHTVSKVLFEGFCILEVVLNVAVESYLKKTFASQSCFLKPIAFQKYV
jgi:hypothetical protein